MRQNKSKMHLSLFQRQVERLECRQLFSTSVALLGTSANDNFGVSFNAANQMYSFSGGTTSPSPVAASDFAGFSVIGGGGTDTLTINGGTPIPSGILTILRLAGKGIDFKAGDECFNGVSFVFTAHAAALASAWAH